MEAIEYQRLALRTMADQSLIRERVYSFGPRATQIQMAVQGLTDEVGEINGAVKKWLEYGQPLDDINLIEEAGDVLWRLAQLMNALGFGLQNAMDANIRKLRLRYPAQYSDEQAEEGRRDREAERKAVEEFIGSEVGRDDPHANWKQSGCP